MIFNKKGQGLPLNTIIIAIIVIVVLVVIILIFTGQIRIFQDTASETRRECQEAFGICVEGDANTCEARGLKGGGQMGCPDNFECCVVG